jgi:sarcosine oxidase/L-pipecolate oxidase
MSFICDGKPSRFTDIYKAQEKLAKLRHDKDLIIDTSTPEAVFQRIHGSGSQPPSREDLGREPRWNVGYCNLDDAFIDAKESIRIYYERCLAEPSITGVFGTAVDHIETSDGIATGVILEDGRVIKAEKTLVATGAWTNKLVYIEGRSYSTAHEVAWIKVTDEEAIKWKNMSITTNLSTGLNLFPPYNGEVKILRRSQGYSNTISVPHPEDPSKIIEISHPRTFVTNPTDMIPEEAELELRDNLREIMPPLADRPFDRTKLCW